MSSRSERPERSTTVTGNSLVLVPQEFTDACTRLLTDVSSIDLVLAKVTFAPLAKCEARFTVSDGADLDLLKIQDRLTRDARQLGLSAVCKIRVQSSGPEIVVNLAPWRSRWHKWVGGTLLLLGLFLTYPL